MQQQLLYLNIVRIKTNKILENSIENYYEKIYRMKLRTNGRLRSNFRTNLQEIFKFTHRRVLTLEPRKCEEWGEASADGILLEDVGRSEPKSSEVQNQPTRFMFSFFVCVFFSRWIYIINQMCLFPNMGSLSSIATLPDLNS